MEAPTLTSLFDWSILAGVTMLASWLGAKMQRRRIRVCCQRARNSHTLR